jgi:hypothetical protein
MVTAGEASNAVAWLTQAVEACETIDAGARALGFSVSHGWTLKMRVVRSLEIVERMRDELAESAAELATYRALYAQTVEPPEGTSG